MLRALLLSTTVLVAAPAVAVAQSSSGSSGSDASSGPLEAIPQGVILATSIIGMPTFIEGEDATAGPIGQLADAFVTTDGQIVGVVVRTTAGRALAVPANLLRQGQIGGAPVLVIDITREQAEEAPDVSEQVQQGGGTSSGDAQSSDGTQSSDSTQSSTGATAGEQSGVTGTTIDGTDATGADTGTNGTGTEGRAGTDGTPIEDDASTDDGSSMDDDASGDDTSTTSN